MTVKLDGDIIMGDYITDKRYHSEGMGSIEDIRYTFLTLGILKRMSGIIFKVKV
jgi:hypothetical protein